MHSYHFIHSIHHFISYHHSILYLIVSSFFFTLTSSSSSFSLVSLFLSTLSSSPSLFLAHMMCLLLAIWCLSFLYSDFLLMYWSMWIDDDWNIWHVFLLFDDIDLPPEERNGMRENCHHMKSSTSVSKHHQQMIECDCSPYFIWVGWMGTNNISHLLIGQMKTNNNTNNNNTQPHRLNTYIVL